MWGVEPQELSNGGLLAPVPTQTIADLQHMVQTLGALPAALDDSERIDRIAAFDKLQAAAAAAQAAEITTFAESQLQQQRSAGVSHAVTVVGSRSRWRWLGRCRLRRERVRSHSPRH